MNKTALIEQARTDWNSSIVAINDHALHGLHAEFPEKLPVFNYVGHSHWSLVERAVFWIYCASQAFKFWNLQESGRLERYQYRNATGSTAMFMRIQDQWGEGSVPLSSIDAAFECSPNSAIRSTIARELSEQAPKVYDVANVIIHDAQYGSLKVEHASLLASSFPTAFTDPYLKKAQLAVTAIGGLVQDQYAMDIDCDLTAFADYKVPRVLRALGILQYSPELSTLIEDHELIAQGSDYERSIRGATILAVDTMARHFDTQAVIVDNLLWRSQSLANGTNFHLTVTDQY